MHKARLVILEPTRKAGLLRLSAQLIRSNDSKETLWWELPEQWENVVTRWSDPWVIGFIFPMMQRGESVHVEGRVTPSLLANLELFTNIWARWAPGEYRSFSITADNEIEMPALQNPRLAVAAFSGGVDSCFTVLRHVRGDVGRRGLRVGAGVVQHGFDIWLANANTNDVYSSLLSDATTMLGSVGLPSIPLKTNFQQMELNWADAFGTQLVGGLSLLSNQFDTALVANDIPYEALGVRWGSHPVLNALLGSKRFKVIDDGGEFSRIDKAALVSTWPEAMRHLHVCFAAHIRGQYENCCECEKCIRTILAFRVAGCEMPSSFRRNVTDAQIRRVRVEPASEIIKQWEKLAVAADNAGTNRSNWAAAIHSVLRRYRWRQFRNRLQRPFIPLRNTVRRLARGSDLSRSQTGRKNRGSSRD